MEGEIPFELDPFAKGTMTLNALHHGNVLPIQILPWIPNLSICLSHVMHHTPIAHYQLHDKLTSILR